MLHGRHLRREERSVTLRPGRPHPPASPRPRSQPGPYPERRRRPAGRRWRGAAGGQRASPKATPARAEGQRCPGLSGSSGSKGRSRPGCSGLSELSPLPDGRDVFPAGPGGEKRSEATGRGHRSSCAGKLPLWRGESYSRVRRWVWLGGRGAERCWGSAPCSAARLPGRRQRVRRRRRMKRRAPSRRTL